MREEEGKFGIGEAHGMILLGTREKGGNIAGTSGKSQEFRGG